MQKMIKITLILCYALIFIFIFSRVGYPQSSSQTMEGNPTDHSPDESNFQYNWSEEQFQSIEREATPEQLPPITDEKTIGEPVMAEFSIGPVISESSDSNTYYVPEFYIAGYAYYMVFRYLSIGGGIKYQTCGYQSSPSDKIILMGEASPGDKLNISLDLLKLPIKIIGLYPLAFLSRFESAVLDVISAFTPYCFTGIEVSFPLSAIYSGIDGVDYDIKDHFEVAFAEYFFGIGLEYTVKVNGIHYGSVCLEYQISSSLGSVIDDVFFRDLIIAESRLVQHYIQFVYRFWFYR